jgi:dynein heavy chain 2
MLESHELMIKEQVIMLKSSIDGKIEIYSQEIEKFSTRWFQLKPKSDISNLDAAHKAIEFIKGQVVEFEELIKPKQQLIDDCAHFGSEAPPLKNLEALELDIRESQDMWSFCEEYMVGLNSIVSKDWITFRMNLGSLDDFFSLWNDKVNSRKIDSIATQILNNMDTYRFTSPYLKFLRGDNWMPEHWGELFRLLEFGKGTTLSDLTVQDVLCVRHNLEKNIVKIKELNNRANGEVAIRDALQELEIWGATALFSLTEYEDAKGNKIQIIKDWKETLTQVGDSQSLLQSLKDSIYFKNFADKAIIWDRKLSEIDEYLRQINNIQRKWVYLEPIFTRGSLPSEQGRFAHIDEDFRSIMSFVSSDKRLLAILLITNIKNILISLGDQLERSQKALNEFLEQKRNKFARFYFLGDDDLLEILGQATNPQVIQTHLKKLFAGVHSVQFDENIKNIIAMRSIHGENVVLKKPVKITNQIEIWLEEFTSEMKSSLQKYLNECLRQSDIVKYPTETICLAEYIHFTSNVEKILKTNGGELKPLQNELNNQLEKLTGFDAETIENKTDREVMELRVKSLILDIIHFIDVVENLKQSNTKNIDDWSWQKQLRFYIVNEKCIIQMHDTEFDYSYEYQGIPPRLVHTSLTDKCYLTLTQAMSSGFGGNPFGPAGTGKTESVKALGVLFGRQVLVFNCDEGIDYKSMGRIFIGIVKCGAWGCFDEFNRLEEAVLSAVSQQIQLIQASLKKKENSVNLLGRTIELDKNSGIFVTLNPAGKGYGGRQKLPDNLKQLFRSVAMTFPENNLIAQVILLSEGFKLATILGEKVVSIFTLSKQFLSHQQHYDWGLRPLKAILGLAGKLLYQEKRNSPISSLNESSVIVKALTGSILSKLTFEDALRFRLLVKDLFPDVKIQEIVYDKLDVALREAYHDLGLIYMHSQAEKVFQLYETCSQRMGVVLVGSSGSGKSTVWKLLSLAWGKIGQKLVIHKSNPKAVERQALLGNMDIDTREWSDGILTYASRKAVKESSDVHTWVICDGDVDPEWVESLNSVLDDNRLLTMPNGERIQFGPNINFIFE